MDAQTMVCGEILKLRVERSTGSVGARPWMAEDGTVPTDEQSQDCPSARKSAVADREGADAPSAAFATRLLHGAESSQKWLQEWWRRRESLRGARRQRRSAPRLMSGAPRARYAREQ